MSGSGATNRVDKVTCLITRQGVAGDELVVFDHPLAGVQVPAGTSLPGEEPRQAALREGWEETGIPGLRVQAELRSAVEATPGCGHGRLAADTTVGREQFGRGQAARVLDSRRDEVRVEVGDEVAWIAADAFSDDVVRHTVHLESDAASPSEWWVVTPDGGGLCWRCRWAPLADDMGIVSSQASWVAAVRDDLKATAPAREHQVPEHPLCNATTHLQFWAFPGVEKRFLVSWLDPDTEIDDSLIRRALVVPRNADGEILVVSGDGRTMWNFPGGGRERGEAIEATARREVAEEACATVTDLQLIGYQHLLHLDDDDNITDEEIQARFAADVTLDRWRERFGVAARQLVTLDKARSLVGVWWQPAMLDRVLQGATRAWQA